MEKCRKDKGKSNKNIVEERIIDVGGGGGLPAGALHLANGSEGQQMLQGCAAHRSEESLCCAGPIHMAYMRTMLQKHTAQRARRTAKASPW